MENLLADPRIRELITEARKARELHARVTDAGGDASEVDEALRSLVADLGEAVLHWADIADAPAAPPGDDAPSDDDIPEDEDKGSWYTDEQPRAVDNPRERLFDDGDLDDHTEVPESDPTGRQGENPDLTDAEDRFEVETIAGLERLRDQEGSSIALLATENAPTWRHHVDELLDLLALPSDFKDSDELAVEVSRVQWATNELQARLTGLPEEIQASLIGMLAARAQHLRRELDVDVGARLSLDRLQRYRITEDLPMVGGLLPTPRSERGSWEADVKGWWHLLRPEK